MCVCVCVCVEYTQINTVIISHTRGSFSCGDDSSIACYISGIERLRAVNGIETQSKGDMKKDRQADRQGTG